MSEGNTCIANPNLDISPLIWFSKGLVSFIFVKSFLKNDALSDDTFLKCYGFTVR